MEQEKRSTFKLLFYLKKNEPKKNGNVPVMYHNFRSCDGYTSSDNFAFQTIHASVIVSTKHTFYFSIGYFSRQLLKYYPKFLFPFLFVILLIEIRESSFIKLIPHVLWIGILHLYIIDSKIGKMLFANKLILNLGRCSYSFYCIHFLILIGTVSLLNSFVIDSKTTYASLLIALGFVLTVVVSNITYQYIELPFMRLGKSLGKNEFQQKHQNALQKMDS